MVCKDMMQSMCANACLCAWRACPCKQGMCPNISFQVRREIRDNGHSSGKRFRGTVDVRKHGTVSVGMLRRCPEVEWDPEKTPSVPCRRASVVNVRMWSLTEERDGVRMTVSVKC